MAVSYRQTLWESHAGQPSTTGAYNVMGLTRVTADDVEQPTDAERLSHLNMSGDPAVMKHFDAKRALKRAPKAVDTSDPRLHTLDEAAKLIDKPVDAVREDANQSVRAGAALLAKYQKDATGSLPEDAGKWYAAVARYSQAPDTKGASLFAKRVYESIRTGESRVTADGQQLALPADPSVKPVRPQTMSLAAFTKADGAELRLPSGGVQAEQLDAGRLRQLQRVEPPRERRGHPLPRHPRHRGRLRRVAEDVPGLHVLRQRALHGPRLRLPEEPG